MQPPSSRHNREMLLPWFLFAVVLIIQAFLMIYPSFTGKAWFTVFAEAYQMSFWPPLIPDFPHSYFYHWMAIAIYWNLLKGIHWLTALIVSSKEANLAYLQIFGNLANIMICVIELLIASLVMFLRRFNPKGKTLFFLFFITITLASYGWFWMYNVSLNLYSFFQTLCIFGFAVNIILIDKAVKKQKGIFWIAFIVGSFGGLLFFEILLFGWIALFMMAPILAIAGLRGIPKAVLGMLGGAVIAPGIALLTFYSGDLDSLASAVHSHINGLLVGFPLTKSVAGDFLKGFLSPENGFFPEQVMIVGGIAMLLISIWLVTAGIKRQGMSKDNEVGLYLDAIFLIILGGHAWPVLSHGSFSPVHSAAMMTLFYVVLRTYVWTGSPTPELYKFSRSLVWAPLLGIIFVLSLFNLFSRTTNLTHIPTMLANEKATAQICTSFDNFLNNLDSHYTVVATPALYFMDLLVGKVHIASSIFMGHGMGDMDITRNAFFEKDRHPRYSYFTPGIVAFVGTSCPKESSLSPRVKRRIKQLSPTCGSFSLGYKRIYYLQALSKFIVRGSVIYPIYRAEWKKLKALSDKVKFINYDKLKVPFRNILIKQYPDSGIEEVYSHHPGSDPGWQVAPIAKSLAKTKLASPIPQLIDKGYLPFLVDVRGGDRQSYLLLLIPEKNSKSEVVIN